MSTDKSSEREAFVYWWRHKYSAADLEGIPEHVALNAAWAAWQARAALPQQAQEAPHWKDAVERAARVMRGEGVNDQGEAWDQCLRILDAAIAKGEQSHD